jgi:PAS domain S-box-containing protein
MKNYSYKSVLKYTIAGLLLGVMFVINAYLLNRQSGFNEPWFHIFDYSPDFIIICLSPLILGLLFCFIGIRWQQLLAFNTQIKNNLTHEQMMSSMADKQLKLLGKVIAQINEAVIVGDNNGCILWTNEGFTKITGYNMEDVLGRKPDNFLLGPLSQKSSFNNIKLNMFKGEAIVEEMVHYRKDGSTYWALISIKPIYNDSGEITNYIAIETDITSRKEKEIALENEIAERKELEAQLMTNKSKLEQAIEIAQVGAWEFDTINKTLYLSKELRTIYHMSLTDDITMDELFHKIHPDDMGYVWKSIEQAAKGETHEIEYRYSLDGELRHMLSNIAPRIDEQGNLTGYVGTVKDITHRKLFELALKKSEEEKAAVLDNAQAVICLHDLDGIIIDVNIAAEKLTGYSKKELIGFSLLKLISPDFHPYFGAYISTLIKNKNAEGSFQIIKKDGSKRAWLYQNALYDHKDGKPYIIASSIDITESVKAQNEIERQQEFINQIIENSPNIIFVMNEQHQVVLHNKTFSHYYLCNGQNSLAVCDLSQGAEDIFLGDLETMLELEDGETIRLEGSMEGTDCTGNSTSWFNVIKKCFKDRKGKKYILCIGMDITGRYQIETDLIAANEMVERSLKVKDQFISNMSHEIRTPLNAVIGFTDLLADTPLRKEQREYIEIINSASQNLLGLINNILDLSKIESGNLALESMPIDVKQIIRDAVKILEPKTKGKGIQLKSIIGTNIPNKVLGDQLRLSQILFNLMGNAIKFTDVGYVEISCKMVNGPDDAKQYLAFTVRDTGIGVPMEKQDAIFERFTQANTDTERLYGGTGLGLNIAKGIVDMHGGSLKMESTPSKGTAFHFILPFDKHEGGTDGHDTDPEDADFIKKTALPVGTNIQVLLAEDNAINAMLAKQVLENGGFTVTHVVNGALALEAVQLQHFDVILMDIQMPVMNGVATTQSIRALEGAVAKIPIVAMTAHSLYGEMQNCYNAGMTGYVSKPFKPENLYAAIIESISIQNNNKKLSHTINDMVTYTS